MTTSNNMLDVLCVGHASYDLIFAVAEHPAADAKIVAQAFSAAGGGPAANAAVQISQLGFRAGFAGYLSHDLYGEQHLQELLHAGVNTDLVVRGQAPTPLSSILVKPDGQRALINYKGDTQALVAANIDPSKANARVMLFDGHEPHISLALSAYAAAHKIPRVLDAGSLHTGTATLLDKVEFLVCSEKFALQIASDVHDALQQLASKAPAVVITLGEHGLIWQRGAEQGQFAAYPIHAIDTTGAGDAFHGAFAAALSAQFAWEDLLHYASAAGALCCTRMGARPGLANREEVLQLAATALAGSASP